MKDEYRFELENGEKEVIGLLDQIMALQANLNRLGEGDWRWLAMSTPEGSPYKATERMFTEIAAQLFGDTQFAHNLRDLCIDNGESPSWNIENNARIIAGLGRF